MKRLAQGAQTASRDLALLSRTEKDRLLKEMAGALRSDAARLIRANRKDTAAAEKKGLAKPLVDRLRLDENKIHGMAKGLEEIAALEDPLGKILEERSRPNGLRIQKVSVPLGVILIIYESRPNVTADCAGLCLKSGNAVILKGGSEAFESNRAIHAILAGVLKKRGVNPAAVSFVASRDRSDVEALLKLEGIIDVVIPRGGESLIRKVAAASKIPVLKHYQGICHTFVDASADLNRALRVVENAKVQNPGVCNAMETLLVHEGVAREFFKPFAVRMKALGVTLRGCARTRALIPWAERAVKKDWRTEYLDLTLSVRVVRDVAQAVEHITVYGSRHSDAILAEDAKICRYFVDRVDSACVFVNTSTRFNDGGEFGMGAEMGISTDKLHARGPVGLKELTSYKYIVTGHGQIRQ